MVHRVVTLKAQGIDHLLTFEFHQDGHREVCKVTERLNGRVIDVDSFSAQCCEELSPPASGSTLRSSCNKWAIEPDRRSGLER